MDQRAVDFVLQVTNQGLMVTVAVCGPPILLSMAVGLLVSLFQAVTQIQEQSLTFVPKMIVIFGALAALGPHLGSVLLRFAQTCFAEFPKVVS